ncbi:MAG: RpiB/LacA/LacB family sugar-phosphate isomerase [Gemmatimonadota bacterium]|nr:RpiB/LacA/LacB family sugar-phosphate isomerase [Gemmatimonadota bacterium]
MIVAIGTDHGGFALKERIVRAVAALGHEVHDCGAMTLDPGDDFPDYAERVAHAIRTGRAERGILTCGSGVGISVAANKFPGVRAAICHDPDAARQGVEDDAMNVLCLGGRVIGPELAAELVTAFLGAHFKSLDRYERRLGKVTAFERAASTPPHRTTGS